MSIPKVVTTDRIPARAIDPDALKVIRRLRRYGHEAYLVGGCVRDLLLGHEPKDFDVITSARPRQVRRLFGNSRVIGRRFRLVHVIFGDNVVEVSTFRADPSQFTETPATSTDEPESRDAEDEAFEGEGRERDARAEDEDEDEEAPEGGEPPASSLEEIGELVQTVHDPLDPDDPGPAVELEPGDDALPAAEEDEDDRAPPPRGREVDEEGDPDLDEDDDRDADEDLDDDRGRRRGRGARDEDIDANNMFGDPEQDARRRDFTINALFYDPDRQEIIDYTGGLEDLERKLVNPINDPDVAFVEDPVRMIRAARFAAKLEFTIEERACKAIDQHRALLGDCSQRRLLEEVLKILKGGYASRCIDLMLSTGLLEWFLPDVAAWIAEVPPIPPTPPAPAADAPAPADAAPAAEQAPTAQAAQVPGAASDEVAALTGAAPAEAPADAEAAPEAAAAPGHVHRQEHGGTVAVPAEPAMAAAPAAEAAPTAEAAPAAPPPREAVWGPSRVVGETGVKLFPRDAWRPDRRMVDAYLRVTWERPPLEGANDWVEDPHVYLSDALFEAAAFARDVVLEETGHVDLAALEAERARAAAVLRVLRWNEKLDQIVASFSPEEPQGRDGGRRGRRRRGRGRDRDHDRGEPRPEGREVAAHAPGGEATSSAPLADLRTLDRRTLLLGYLEGLDRLNHRGVPLTPAVQLSVLFAPMLLTRLEAALRQRGPSKQPSSEELADDLLFPIARRHSLARRDRDRVKRIVLSLRRMLSGELRRRARHGGRMGKVVSRDYFREAIVVLWLHCRATSSGWDEFRYWEGRAKPGRGGR